LKQPEAIRLTEKDFTPIAPTLEALRERIKHAQDSLFRGRPLAVSRLGR